MSAPFVGLDIAKDTSVAGTWPAEHTWEVAKTPAGIEQLTTAVRERAPACVVLEATGGSAHAAAAALAAAGLPVAVIKPRQARAVATAIQRLATTDRIDALVLARCAEAVRPPIRPLPDAAAEERTALVTRRTQVIGMRTAEKNRLKQAAAAVRAHSTTHRAWLDAELEEIDTDLCQRLKASPIWRETEDVVRRITGIGPVASLTVLAALPELGNRSEKESAARAGLAPIARDSGQFRGTRMIWGGRTTVRQDLDLATLVAARHTPVIRAFYQRLLDAFYQRLLDAGKPKNLALTACMQKLLTSATAILRTRKPWNPQQGLPAAA